MELIPIIKASLGIFTVITSITFMISYTVYKVKSRNRIKPYLKDFDEADSVIKLEVLETKVNENEIDEKNKRFKIINENGQKISVEENDDELVRISKPAEISNHQVVVKRHSNNEVFNIYSFYSTNDIRPLHKLKFDLPSDY